MWDDNALFSKRFSKFGDIMGEPPPPPRPSGGAAIPAFAITGTTLKAWIIVENWEREGDYQTLFCGTFEVDESTMKGFPPTVEIKAVSVPLTSTARTETKVDKWESTTFKEVAQDIARRNSLALLYEHDDPIPIDRVDQRNETDLSFLGRMAKDNGLCLKVTADRIVVYSEAAYEQRPPVAAYDWTDRRILSYEIKQSAAGLASGVQYTYSDPVSGQQIEEVFTPPDDAAPKVAPTLKVNKRPMLLMPEQVL